MRNTITEDKLFDNLPAAIEDPAELSRLTEMFDKAIEEAGDTENKRITILNQLHNFYRQSPFVIGDILYKWDETLKKQFNKAKDKGQLSIENPLPNGIVDWFRKNPDRLSFGYSMARKYIQYRMDYEREPVEDLGVKKASIIKQIKNEEIREKIKEKAIEEAWSSEKVQEEVKKTNFKLDRQEDYDKMKNKIKINVTLEKNNVVVHFQNQNHRDIGNIYIQRQIEIIKQKIIDMTD